jgi:hypothetical protein
MGPRHPDRDDECSLISRTRHLVSSGGGLAQGLAVVGRVDEHDEHVEAALEGEVVARTSAAPGRWMSSSPYSGA